MNTIVIKLEPARLTNPDLDLRYRLPSLLAERSEGVIKDDGYDYVGPSQAMALFLEASDLKRAIACIMDVIANHHVLENDLRFAATVAVQHGDRFDVIYPADCQEEFVV